MLAKSLPDGSVTGPDSFSFDADVGQDRRDGIVETVQVQAVALAQDDPPYTLYRISLDNDAAGFGSSGFVNKTVLAENIRSLRFRYFDRTGNEISPPGGDDSTAGFNARSAISRITVELETLTRNPDPTSREYEPYSLAGQVRPRNRGKIGMPDFDTGLYQPSQPEAPTLIEGHCKGLIVQWPPNPVHDHVVFYRILYGTNPFSLDRVASTTNTDYYLNNLSDGVSYTVRIEAISGAGISSSPSTPSSRVTQNLNTPDSPQNFVSTLDGNGNVLLDWDSVTQNTAPIPDATLRDLSGYRVYRATTSGFTPDSSTRIKSTSSSRYTDVKTVACRPYYYRVTAYDRCGVESDPTDELSGSVTTTVAPREPGGVNAFLEGGTQIRLSWQRVLDDINGDPIWIEDYRVFRTAALPEGVVPVVPDDFGFLATVVGATEYTDTMPPPTTVYWYLVTTIDDCGNESGYSAAASASCSFSGDVVFDQPDYADEFFPSTLIDVEVLNGSGGYTEMRLDFVNETDGSTYQELVTGPGPEWLYSMRGPGEGPFTEGWYTITAAVDQQDGLGVCTRSATTRVHLSDGI